MQEAMTQLLHCNPGRGSVARLGSPQAQPDPLSGLASTLGSRRSIQREGQDSLLLLLCIQNTAHTRYTPCYKSPWNMRIIIAVPAQPADGVI